MFPFRETIIDYLFSLFPPSGGPVDMVYPGDEVLEVQGTSVVGMRRLEAWTLIRALPPGPVDVVLHRSHKHPET